jgi:hypothetical protein
VTSTEPPVWQNGCWPGPSNIHPLLTPCCALTVPLGMWGDGTVLRAIGDRPSVELLDQFVCDRAENTSMATCAAAVERRRTTGSDR